MRAADLNELVDPAPADSEQDRPLLRRQHRSGAFRAYHEPAFSRLPNNEPSLRSDADLDFSFDFHGFSTKIEFATIFIPATSINLNLLSG